MRLFHSDHRSACGSVSPNPVLAGLAGEPGGTPGPVEMEDPRDKDEPFASW